MTNIDSPNIDLYQITYSDYENNESEIFLKKDNGWFIGIEIPNRNIFKYNPKKNNLYSKPLKKPIPQYKYIKDIHFDIPPDSCIIIQMQHN